MTTGRINQVARDARTANDERGVWLLNSTHTRTTRDAHTPGIRHETANVQRCDPDTHAAERNSPEVQSKQERECVRTHAIRLRG